MNNPKNKLFVVVDMQNDFSQLGTIPVKGIEQLASDIHTFLVKNSDKTSNYIAFSQDWHPHHHISFKEYGKHCVRLSWGSKLIKPLRNWMADIIIKKAKKANIEEFSAFNKGSKTKLYKFIMKHNIEEVYVMGVVKELCVLATCKESINLGLKTYLVEDLTLALDNKKFYDQIPSGLNLIKSFDIY